MASDMNKDLLENGLARASISLAALRGEQKRECVCLKEKAHTNTFSGVATSLGGDCFAWTRVSEFDLRISEVSDVCVVALKHLSISKLITGAKGVLLSKSIWYDMIFAKSAPKIYSLVIPSRIGGASRIVNEEINDAIRDRFPFYGATALSDCSHSGGVFAKLLFSHFCPFVRTPWV